MILVYMTYTYNNAHLQHSWLVDYASNDNKIETLHVQVRVFVTNESQQTRTVLNATSVLDLHSINAQCAKQWTQFEIMF